MKRYFFRHAPRPSYLGSLDPIHGIFSFIRTCLLLLFCLEFCPGIVHAQDYVTFYRGDEVGPRSLDMDEETFLNILSFEQPLETLQPWLAAKSGYRVALGSLSTKDLWLEQELKHTVVVSDSFRVSALARQAVELDSDYIFIQPTMEFQLNPYFEFIVPTNLDTDKGGLDGGLGLRFRDQARGIDYLQLVWTRADVLFDDNSREFPDSEVRDPADSLELQAQGLLSDLGKTSLKISYQPHSAIKYEELGSYEEYRRFSAWLLHRYDLNDLNRFFFEFESDSANEDVSPFLLQGIPDEFDGDRDMYRARLEYQKDLTEDGIRRIRGGFQYVYYSENENLPAEPVLTHTSLRRESMLYGGYRIPLGQSEDLSLETTVYLDWLNNRYRYPNNPFEDERDPSFQGKVNFTFLWRVSEKVDFVLDPSFELDSFGWGGGGIQVRCLF